MLSSRLHMSLDRCQEETTFFDFLMWVEFFKQEEDEKLRRIEKQDFYLAQIAAEVRRAGMNTKNPQQVKLSDFFVKLKDEEEKKLTREERTKIAKAYWLKAIPMNPPKNMKVKRNKKQRGK